MQFNTDNHLHAGQNVVPELEAQLSLALARHAAQITRVEVYFQDVNADKAGEFDKRCTIEVRLSGYDPIAVTHEADTVPAVFKVATDKLVRLLDKRLDKLRNPKAHSRPDRELELGA